MIYFDLELFYLLYTFIYWAYNVKHSCTFKLIKYIYYILYITYKTAYKIKLNFDYLVTCSKNN